MKKFPKNLVLIFVLALTLVGPLASTKAGAAAPNPDENTAAPCCDIDLTYNK